MKMMALYDQANAGTILVIDDDPYARDIVGRLLEALGHQVILAKDGIDGFTLFCDNLNNIKAVLLDCMMPGMNGDEVYKNLRKVSADIPIIICSSCLPKEYGCDCPTDDVPDFLQKPVSFDQLRIVIGKATHI
jgi:two-component system cell cycle sensor histidine kinase/response regulator CckA